MESYRHVIYRIESRPELADWLHGRVEPAFSEVLTKPITYHTQEVIDPNWHHADQLLKVKLAFVHALRQRAPLADDAGFSSIFGSIGIGETLFDQWWLLHRYEAEQELGELEKWLKYGREPAPAGNERVDSWVASLRTPPQPVHIAAVLFHSPGNLQISPIVHGSWRRAPLEVLEAAGAAGGFGNDVYDSCAEFVAWCLSKNPRPASLGVLNIPGAPQRDSDHDPYEWYERTLAEVAGWEKPPVLVDLDEFVITHRDEVLSPPGKRGRKRANDRRVVRPGSPFPWGWFGQDLGGLRERKGTYTCYLYDSLPPLRAPLDGTFRWLQSAPVHERGLGNVQATEAALNRLLAENIPGLPREFIAFFQSPALWWKVRSCTGCYLRLDSASTAIPGSLGRLVRFLSDNQDCIHFHLHISPCTTKHSVVATYHFSGSEYAHLQGGLPHAKDITTCAASFEEFMYRFWLENELWYAMNRQGVMPEYGEDYLAHYRSV